MVKRCSQCGVNYPHDVPFEHCPRCDTIVDDWEDDEVTPDWEDNVFIQIINEPETTDTHPVNNIVHILTLDAPAPPWNFVAHEDLLNMGYRNLEDFDIVRLNGTYYELEGYLEGADCWWIESINVDKEVREMENCLA